MRKLKFAAAAVALVVIGFLPGCGAGIRKGNPQWDPPVLDKTGCPVIDGLYYNYHILFGHFEVYRPAEGETIPVIKTYSMGDFAPLPSEETRKFHREGVTRFEQKGQILEVTLLSPARENYLRIEVDMNHPWVGCHDGKLVIRHFTLIQGGPGTCGSAYTSDRSYHKRSDGALQVDIKSRRWNCSMNKEPRRTERTLIFDAVGEGKDFNRDFRPRRIEKE